MFSSLQGLLCLSVNESPCFPCLSKRSQFLVIWPPFNLTFPISLIFLSVLHSLPLSPVLLSALSGFSWSLWDIKQVNDMVLTFRGHALFLIRRKIVDGEKKVRADQVHMWVDLSKV